MNTRSHPKTDLTDVPTFVTEEEFDLDDAPAGSVGLPDMYREEPVGVPDPKRPHREDDWLELL